MSVIVYDVVCGMRTEYGRWLESVEYNGKNYYFCCDGCSGSFRKSPEYHLANFAEEYPGIDPSPVPA